MNLNYVIAKFSAKRHNYQKPVFKVRKQAFFKKLVNQLKLIFLFHWLIGRINNSFLTTPLGCSL